MSNIGIIKSHMASYMGRTVVTDFNPSTLDPNGINIDLGLLAINTASLRAQRIRDFQHSRKRGALAIAQAGTDLSSTTGLGTGATVKRVLSVELPIAAGDYVPIEFMTDDEYGDRVRRQVGRQAYSLASTASSLGISDGNPIAYQLGQTIILAPASSFTFPISAQLTVVRFMPPYTADADHDFLCDNAPDYLEWAGLLELNKLFRRYVPKQESAIDEGAVEAFAKEALQELLIWDDSVRAGTSRPAQEDGPPK